MLSDLVYFLPNDSNRFRQIHNNTDIGGMHEPFFCGKILTI